MGAEVWVPGVLGAAGLMQAEKARKGQEKTSRKGLKIADRESAAKLDIMDLLKGIAEGYDPAKEDQAAVEHAQGVSEQSLRRSLGGLRVANPAGSGDSEFHVSAQRAVNDALDPLKAFTAERKSSETPRKAQLFQAVLGAPIGNLSESYFRGAATMPQANFGAPAQMLSQALQGLFGAQDNSILGRAVREGRLQGPDKNNPFYRAR